MRPRALPPIPASTRNDPVPSGSDSWWEMPWAHLQSSALCGIFTGSTRMAWCLHQSLLADGVDISPISTGNAMIIAARAGHADCVRLLLEMDNADAMKFEALRTALFS